MKKPECENGGAEIRQVITSRKKGAESLNTEQDKSPNVNSHVATNQQVHITLSAGSMPANSGGEARAAECYSSFQRLESTRRNYTWTWMIAEVVVAPFSEEGMTEGDVV